MLHAPSTAIHCHPLPHAIHLVPFRASQPSILTSLPPPLPLPLPLAARPSGRTPPPRTPPCWASWRTAFRSSARGERGERCRQGWTSVGATWATAAAASRRSTTTTPAAPRPTPSLASGAASPLIGAPSAPPPAARPPVSACQAVWSLSAVVKQAGSEWAWQWAWQWACQWHCSKWQRVGSGAYVDVAFTHLLPNLPCSLSPIFSGAPLFLLSPPLLSFPLLSSSYFKSYHLRSLFAPKPPHPISPRQSNTTTRPWQQSRRYDPTSIVPPTRITTNHRRLPLGRPALRSLGRSPLHASCCHRLMWGRLG
ncbi:unnamed protein product [Closterium sp. NIES-54]